MLVNVAVVLLALTSSVIADEDKPRDRDTLVDPPQPGTWIKPHQEPFLNEQDFLNINGAGKNKYNRIITWVPLIPKTWSAEGTLKVGGVPGFRGQIQFEPRAGLISGSSETVKQWWAKVPGSEPCGQRTCDSTGFYTYPCSNPPNVSLAFGGHEFPISPAGLSLGPTNDTNITCVGSIIGWDDAYLPENTWVVGDPFLKSVYAVFDKANSRVGFAPLLDVDYL